jgi:hypothetical protein
MNGTNVDNETLQKQTFENLPLTKQEGKEKAIQASSAKPVKDNWDKIAALAPIISGALMFLVGGYFTYTYNQQQLKVQELQTIEKFIPHLMGNDRSKRAAILAIYSLTNTELASKFAEIFASQGTVSALKSISESGSAKEKEVANLAISKALENLALRESRLSELESAVQQAIETQKASSQSVDNISNMSALNEAETYEKLAWSLKEKGLPAKAELLLKQALAVRVRAGGENKELIAAYKKLAELQAAQGNTAEAEATGKKIQGLETRLNALMAAPAAGNTLSEESLQNKPTVEASSEVEEPLKEEKAN